MKRIVGAAAVAGIAIFGGAGAFDDETTRDASGEIIEAGGLGVYAMQIGDCVQLPDETTILSVEAVPCSTPHDAQVFAQTEAVYAGEYDDTSPVFFEALGESCLSHFESFVGVSYNESTLYLDTMYPVAEGWADGDRTVTCLIVPAEGELTLTGDMEGSGR